MRTFKDTEGREWQIAVNVDAIKRVRDLCEVDLLSVVANGSELLQQLSTDYVLLADVLYSLCKPQADGRNLTDEQFGQALSGDSLWDGFNGLQDELADFFPDPRRRHLMKQVIEKVRAVTGIAIEQAQKELDAIDLASILKSSTTPSGTSPASSASTPAPAPSAS